MIIFGKKKLTTLAFLIAFFFIISSAADAEKEDEEEKGDKNVNDENVVPTTEQFQDEKSSQTSSSFFRGARNRIEADVEEGESGSQSLKETKTRDLSLSFLPTLNGAFYPDIEFFCFIFCFKRANI